MVDEYGEPEEEFHEGESTKELREDDEIDDSEEAFMRGYDEDAEASAKGEDKDA